MSIAEKKDTERADRLRALQIDRPRGSPSTPWLAVVLGIAVLAGVLGAGSIYLPLPASSVTPAPVPPMAATAPAHGLAPVARSDWIVAGYLVARRESLVSSEVTGRVSRLLVEEGASVEEGQIIAKLDGTLASADLAIAQARAEAAARSIDAVQAERIEAQRALERRRKLIARNLSSDAELGKDEARFAVLTAEYEKARADRKMASLEADRAAAVVAMHTIAAPFAGTVSSCSVDVGETVSPMSATGSPRDGICRIVDTSSIEVELEVPEKMLSRVPLGTKVQVILDAFPDHGQTATVREIAPTVNREKSTIKVRLGFDEPDPRRRPNMALKVNLLDGKPEVGQ
ncbi:MAG: efflux RND transporter periplasmic adaptor subunit [Pseudomonadota bacterium]